MSKMETDLFCSLAEVNVVISMTIIPIIILLCAMLGRLSNFTHLRTSLLFVAENSESFFFFSFLSRID